METAKKAFDFADRYRGKYSDSLESVVCPFYCSYSGYEVRAIAHIHCILNCTN